MWRQSTCCPTLKPAQLGWLYCHPHLADEKTGAQRLSWQSASDDTVSKWQSCDWSTGSVFKGCAFSCCDRLLLVFPAVSSFTLSSLLLFLFTLIEGYLVYGIELVSAIHQRESQVYTHPPSPLNIPPTSHPIQFYFLNGLYVSG